MGEGNLLDDISIHAPSRERHKANDWAIRCVHISIHAPSRERQFRFVKVVKSCYFNPRSLAGATFADDDFIRFLLISIHAPSRERHFSIVLWYYNCSISIHAPSRERLIVYLSAATGQSDFNPRSLAGATSTLPCLY